MKALLYAISIGILYCSVPVKAQDLKKVKLMSRLQHIADTTQGKVGIGVMGLDFGDTILINDDMQFPMQSVFKFPLAIYILNKVDKGTLSLTKEYKVHRSTLMKDTWSPMLQDYKKGDIKLTLPELLRYAVSKSDNNACDILFNLAGGTGNVQEFFRNAGVADMSIAATEAEMAAERNAQYTNWCRPSAMLQVLDMFYSKKLLSPSTNELLMKLMEETDTGPQRIKGLLPQGTVVAHKTGTGNSDESGTTATNDVGIITLSGNRHYALVVYVSDYKGRISTGEQTIAAISKLVWDYYSAGK